MDRLTRRDLRGILDFLREGYAFEDRRGFIDQAVRSLHRLVPSDITAYNEADLGRHTIWWATEPRRATSPGDEATFAAHMQEHPRIAHYVRTGDGRALRFSDLVSRGALHRLGLYNELFRRLGIEHQLAAIYPLRPGIFIGLALNRGARDYSGCERLVLDALRPHLVQMERLAERMGAMAGSLAHATEALEVIAEGVILLDAAGRVRLTTARAREWLASWFGASRGGTRLPDALARWVRAEQARLEQSDDVPVPLAPLVVENDRRRLCVRLQPGIGRSTLLLEEQVTAPDPVALEPLGLSRREAEVLAWVSQGKTNPEIASILGISPRTVQTHLDHIFGKLGVETRTGAAARALQAAGAGRREPHAGGRLDA